MSVFEIGVLVFLVLLVAIAQQIRNTLNTLSRQLGGASSDLQEITTLLSEIFDRLPRKPADRDFVPWDEEKE